MWGGGGGERELVMGGISCFKGLIFLRAERGRTYIRDFVVVKSDEPRYFLVYIR